MNRIDILQELVYLLGEKFADQTTCDADYIENECGDCFDFRICKANSRIAALLNIIKQDISLYQRLDKEE